MICPRQGALDEIGSESGEDRDLAWVRPLEGGTKGRRLGLEAGFVLVLREDRCPFSADFPSVVSPACLRDDTPSSIFVTSTALARQRLSIPQSSWRQE